jgi:hypothetical protein
MKDPESTYYGFMNLPPFAPFEIKLESSPCTNTLQRARCPKFWACGPMEICPLAIVHLPRKIEKEGKCREINSKYTLAERNYLQKFNSAVV